MILIERKEEIKFNMNLFEMNKTIFILPKVILIKILLELEVRDYANLFCVCKQFHSLKDSFYSSLMNKLCREYKECYRGYQEIPKLFKELPFKILLQTKLSANPKKSEYRCYDSSLGFHYEGRFDCMMNGVGICYYKNGSIYEGEFVNNTREGRGIYR